MRQVAQHFEQGTGRQIRYRAIADDLRARIGGGEWAAGTVLPSESDLATAYAASRVTVRKALDRLRDDGLVESRQGFGWIVAGDRLRQTLDVLATIEGQLAAQGRHAERRVLSFRFVAPPAAVASALGVDEVLEVVRVNLADRAPFAVVTVWCPADLGGALSRDDVERAPFSELLPVSIASATQTVGAAAASDDDAGALDVPVGSPLLVVDRVSRDTSGRPVLVSEHRFPAHRTEFVVETTAADLRLVDSD